MEESVSVQKSITRNLHVDDGIVNIITKISKNAEAYEFDKQPVGRIYSAAETAASRRDKFTNESHIHFVFQTMLKEIPVDETLAAIIFKHDTLEVNLITVLIDSLDVYPLLTVIKFEFCRLTARHIEEFAELLYLLKSIKEISVNGNPIPEQNYHLLLQREVCCISLKYCNINTEGMKNICSELNKPHENPLLHLNLASNALYDEGALYVGKLLRMNRTLLSVNLADNKITSTGIRPLLDALQKFQLDEEDLIERRRIKFNHQKKIYSAGMYDEYEQFYGFIDSQALSQVSFLDFENSYKLFSEELCPERNKIDSMTKTKEASFSRKSKYTKSKMRILERRSTIPGAPIALPYHPTLQDTIEENGKWFCSGNNVLSYINLSYNKIKKVTVPHIVEMLNYQKLQYNENPSKNALTRISLGGNPLSIEDMYQVQRALEKKFSDSSIVTDTSLSNYQVKRIGTAPF